MAPDSPPSPGDHAGLLVAAAWRALQCGHDPTARDLAQALLANAEAVRDRHGQAHALSILAHCDRMNSRLRQAHASGQLAVRVFRELGDVAGEAVALSTLAHVASSLGRTEEAVEAALLSVSLQEQLPHGPQRALSLNYLGAAYFWSRSFDRATAAFEAAASACADNAPPQSPYQPRLNLLFAEAFRLAMERFYAGSLPSVARLGLLLDQCEATRLAWGDECLLPGLARLSQAFRCVLSGLYFCWSGSFDEARLALADAQARTDALEPQHWIKAACAWLHAELAWSTGDWAQADVAVDSMVAAAELSEHEQFACLAHTIASGLMAQRGETERAMAHLRALRLREERIRAESLESRARIVQWQLDARRSAQDLERLERASRRYEKLALEDPLTGIANRRSFEARLDETLADATGRPVSVALVDIDDFKQVNDRHSHQVGDRVLRQLADLLVSQVRERDLAARLAGDEFVLLLCPADHGVARQVCERVQRAVLAFDWSTLSAGLTVSVSIGVAQSVPGDTGASLLHRSDVSMYRSKRDDGHGPVAPVAPPP